jgi:4-hydroxybenzoate polyprenyltransferase
MLESEAEAALAAVERGRRQVVDEIDMPRWYWWGLALGWIGVGLASDLGSAWVAGAATLAFGAVHASVSRHVLGGRRRTGRVSVRADVAGHDVPRLAIASLLALAALTTAGGFAANADGARHPATVSAIVVALVILLGGPQLMAAVRRRAARRPLDA